MSDTPDLEARVTALEAKLAPAEPWEPAEWTEEQFAAFKREFELHPLQMAKLPAPERLLGESEVRQLLRECVTVVSPGETLIIRTDDLTPEQMREYQDYANRAHEAGIVSCPVLVVHGSELGVAESAEPQT